MIKAVIVTPSAQEYEGYIHACKLLRYEYPHISNGDMIRGYIDTLAIRIGSWYKLDDLHYFNEYAESHRIDVVDSNV